jgi:hypothetical protein
MVVYPTLQTYAMAEPVDDLIGSGATLPNSYNSSTHNGLVMSP